MIEGRVVWSGDGAKRREKWHETGGNTTAGKTKTRHVLRSKYIAGPPVIM